LRDSDGDGIPDQVDELPYKSEYSTLWDQQVAIRESLGDSHADAVSFANKAYTSNLLPSTKTKADLFDLTKAPANGVSVYGADLGYPLIKSGLVKLNVYSTFAQIQGHGWGTTLPGVSLSIGNFFNFSAEYRKQSKEFVFGYFNQTYEFQRSVFQAGQKNPLTKDSTLLGITQGMSGFYVGLSINLMDFASITANYSDMSNGGSTNVRSIYGEASLKKKLIPGINDAKAYYLQNNVQDFQNWKTPSTILGYILDYNIGGAAVGFEYRYNFQYDATGQIQTLKTILLRTSVKF
jgi:hypothetical protein